MQLLDCDPRVQFGEIDADAAFTGTWTHKTIFNYRGLIEMFETHGFRSVSIAGAGYFPLPAFLGRMDPRHSAFITVFARK